MSSEEFFKTFIKDQTGIITKICRAYTDNEDDFQDYFQEVALQLWRSYENFNHQSKVSTWVYRVALNVCLTHFKKQKRKVTTVALDQIHFEPVGFDDTKKEQVDLLYRSIRQLKEIDRAIILLYLEEKSYKEMAEILGMSVTNIGAKINRIKSQLKAIIDGQD
ncbi:MAG: sigma-70 family RNA polymerase sigma factor [Cyclobacteriaceae bacterium]